MVLLAPDVDFVTVPLEVSDTGDICEDVTRIDWVAGDCEPVRCVCAYCHHQFSEGYAENVDDFEDRCHEFSGEE